MLVPFSQYNALHVILFIHFFQCNIYHLFKHMLMPSNSIKLLLWSSEFECSEYIIFFVLQCWLLTANIVTLLLFHRCCFITAKHIIWLCTTSLYRPTVWIRGGLAHRKFPAGPLPNYKILKLQISANSIYTKRVTWQCKCKRYTSCRL